MKLSEPTDKVLNLMEVLMARRQEHPKHRELCDLTQLSGATLLRMLMTLEQRGYVRRDSQKRYHVLFRMDKDLPFSGAMIHRLRDALHALVRETGQSAEILTVKGEHLFWYDKLEPKNPGIQIVAKIGLKRSLYELDAPSRVALSYLGLKQIQKTFRTGSFYRVYPLKTPLSWKEAGKLIETTDRQGVTYDSEGNAHGVRRYACAIQGPDEQLLFLLTVAEAAIPANHLESHRDKVLCALRKQKQLLEKL